MDNMESRKNRLALALQMRNMKQVELCEKTGIKKASVNGWVKNNWQPKQVALYKMAKVLDVSELWLAGYDVPMDRPLEQKRRDSINDMIELLKSNQQYRDAFDYMIKLNDNQLDTVISMLKGLTEE